MIAITKVPVMYRLLEDSGEPAKTADTRREHPPKEAVDRPGEPVEGARWKQPPPTICWEASDQRRGRNATHEVAFRAFAGEVAKGFLFELRSYRRKSLGGHLLCCAAACSIEFAYQAAEANHPCWAEKARR
jgi:hypothetical protein